MIQPVNVSDITRAIVAMLSDDLRIGQAGVRVERSEQFDADTNDYVGVYRNSQRFPPRTLGMGTGYRRQDVELVAIVRACNHSSGADCEDRLEEMVQDFVRVLLSDPSLRGTVDNLGEEFEVKYDSYDQKGGMWVQKAVVFFTCNLRVIST